ncbi:hypothetical protein WKH57_01430 [Niallia taxi]|uniref:hypothetical protein n=1 Tax=Niallia taxi TaxID=2499688 RepID=UPI003181371A
MKTVIGKLEISYAHVINELGVSLEKAKEMFNADNIAALNVEVVTIDGTVIKISGSYLNNSTVEDVEDDEEDE